MEELSKIPTYTFSTIAYYVYDEDNVASKTQLQTVDCRPELWNSFSFRTRENPVEWLIYNSIDAFIAFAKTLDDIEWIEHLYEQERGYELEDLDDISSYEEIPIEWADRLWKEIRFQDCHTLHDALVSQEPSQQLMENGERFFLEDKHGMIEDAFTLKLGYL